MSNVGDLRKPKIRAQEVVDSILRDQQPPDMIFFQEAFNQGATRVLCDGIKNEYPYIIYNVGPQIGGFPSGQMIASKFPIKSVDYERFQGMVGVENMAPRGILAATIETADKKEMKIYSVHTAPLLGNERAQARVQQLEHIQTKMEKDSHPDLHQVLVGDFNTSRVNAWGEDNAQPANQAEAPVLDKMKEFKDLYLENHTEEVIDGKFIVKIKDDESPMFLAKDNAAIGHDLIYPTASWYTGPFNHEKGKKGVVLEHNIKSDRKKHGFDKPDKLFSTANDREWGTKNWRTKQTANTARFDYILVPPESDLTGKAEIRRVIPSSLAQSAPTDHLPVDAIIWNAPRTRT